MPNTYDAAAEALFEEQHASAVELSGGHVPVEAGSVGQGVGNPLIRMMGAPDRATASPDSGQHADAGYCADGVCSM